MFKKPQPKQNCWEFKRCGREPGGIKTKVCSTCPAATDRRLDGVHGGNGAGRACWVVAGTLCGGKMQGSFAQKVHSCLECEFYQQVRKEEWPRFELLIALREKLQGSAAPPAPPAGPVFTPSSSPGRPGDKSRRLSDYHSSATLCGTPAPPRLIPNGGGLGRM